MSEEESVVAVEEEATSELPVADFGAILALPSNQYKWVEVPEWKSRVKIKSLTKAEQIRMSKKATKNGMVDETLLEIHLIAEALVEPKLSVGQVDELFAKSDAKALNRILAAALTFSGLTENYIAQAEVDLKS